MRRVAILLALAALACGQSGSSQPAPGSGSAGSGSGSGAGSTEDFETPAPTFAIEEVSIPSDRTWKAAAKTATRLWAEAFNKIGVTRARVTPLTSPDGAIAPYLVQVEAFAEAESKFKGVALVSRTDKLEMINGGGIKRLERHLKAIGFPATKLPMGHLIEMLHATAAIPAAWVRPPSVVGWTFDKPAPSTLTYDDKGALLVLFREGKAEGSAAAPLEKIEVRIDPGALITTTTLRKTGDAWERFSE